MALTAPLRLLAQDADDLSVVSTALQDAVARVGDIVFEPKAGRLTVAVNRYRWEAGAQTRIRSGLQLGGVLKVRTRRIRRSPPDAVIELLAMTFDPVDPPGGLVTLSCAGGGDLQAVVECLDVVLADLSDPWPTPRTPVHGA
jgi:hypothetical protein